jgi:hypothetical protein
VPLAAESFEVVIWIMALVVLPLAAYAFMGAGEALRNVGKDAFSMEHDLPPVRRGPAPPTPAAIRDEEIRQMLQAKSDRAVARGEAALDVEAEFKRLAESDPMNAPVRVQQDAALREEVRQLVVARNERRMRRGQEPLDVETEVDRQLRDLGA